MSPKSKKYRKPNIPAASLATATADATTTGNITKSTSKTTGNAIPIPTAQSFVRDLSWIGLTALIVIILMVVAYYVVPR
jgi:hypothetical protein